MVGKQGYLQVMLQGRIAGQFNHIIRKAVGNLFYPQFLYKIEIAGTVRGQPADPVAEFAAQGSVGANHLDIGGALKIFLRLAGLHGNDRTEPVAEIA